jgi:hypothetical protein
VTTFAADIKQFLDANSLRPVGVCLVRKTHHARLGRSLLRLKEDGFLMAAYRAGKMCSRKLNVRCTVSLPFIEKE